MKAQVVCPQVYLYYLLWVRNISSLTELTKQWLYNHSYIKYEKGWDMVPSGHAYITRWLVLSWGLFWWLLHRRCSNSHPKDTRNSKGKGAGVGRRERSMSTVTQRQNFVWESPLSTLEWNLDQVKSPCWAAKQEMSSVTEAFTHPRKIAQRFW